MVRKLLIILCIVSMIVFASCKTNERQYEFPFKLEYIDKEIVKQGLDWQLDKILEGESLSEVRYVFLNNEGIEFSFYSSLYNSKLYRDEKGMSFGWYLPQEITKDQVHSFYYEELPKIFDLISALYGNDKELRNGLREFSDYYEKSEESLSDGIYWAKRIEDNHISINANLETVKTGMIMVNSNTVFEDLILKSRMEKYKNSVITDNLKISSSSIEQMKKNNVTDAEYGGQYFILQGYLEEINEVNNVPENLKSANMFSLKPNKDTYLKATLVDETGSINVFIETTSLSIHDLEKKREHVVLMIYDNEPFYIVRCSSLINSSEN